ncbi:MAG TPA: hypothetical protein P5117_03615 [Spirochaetia bacterium]|nr:hypothetical protein [Spirochaetia bacterium]
MKSKLSSILLTCFLAVMLPFDLSAQNVTTVYRIESVEYRIEGRTREKALADRLEIAIGREFRDLASLEAYVADRRQVLVIQRVLEDAELLYSIGEPVDSVLPVRLTVRARDTWNLIILPYPKYSTNDGLLLSMRLRNYNFLGTMETLYLDLDYRYDESGNQSFGIGTEFTYPFQSAGLDWSVHTEQDFAVSLAGLISYVGQQTLRLHLGEDSFKRTIRVGQKFLWNQYAEDDADLDHLVLHSLTGISTDFRLLSLGGLGYLTLTPDLEAGWKYRVDGTEISPDRKGPYVTGSYSLGAGRVDWSGNLRQGTLVSLYNAYTYNLQSTDWTIVAIAQARHHESWFGNRLGLNSRLTLYGSFLGVASDIGGYIRGIPDAYIDADYAVFANLDLPIRLFDFKPSILIKKKWFDFEAHASPFVDAALVRPGEAADFEPYLCAGLELFGFLKQARSIYARLSLGVDALGYLDTRSLSGNYELFFGLGHDY